MTGNCDIEFATLVDYVEDRADAETRARLSSHLATGCRQCEQSLAWLRRTIYLMKTDDSIAPPSRVVKLAKNLFQERSKATPWVRRLSALFLFDSGFQIRPMGTRSGGTMVRQVLYGAEQFDVDFLIQEARYGRVSTPPLRARVDLSCQILPRGDDSGRDLSYEVTLARGHERVFSGRASRLGEFTVDDLSPGTYELHILLEDGELIVDGLEI